MAGTKPAGNPPTRDAEEEEDDIQDTEDDDESTFILRNTPKRTSPRSGNFIEPRKRSNPDISSPTRTESPLPASKKIIYAASDADPAPSALPTTVPAGLSCKRGSLDTDIPLHPPSLAPPALLPTADAESRKVLPPVTKSKKRLSKKLNIVQLLQDKKEKDKDKDSTSLPDPDEQQHPATNSAPVLPPSSRRRSIILESNSSNELEKKESSSFLNGIASILTRSRPKSEKMSSVNLTLGTSEHIEKKTDSHDRVSPSSSVSSLIPEDSQHEGLSSESIAEPPPHQHDISDLPPISGTPPSLPPSPCNSKPPPPALHSFRRAESLQIRTSTETNQPDPPSSVSSFPGLCSPTLPPVPPRAFPAISLTLGDTLTEVTSEPFVSPRTKSNPTSPRQFPPVPPRHVPLSPDAASSLAEKRSSSPETDPTSFIPLRSPSVQKNFRSERMKRFNSKDDLALNKKRTSGNWQMQISKLGGDLEFSSKSPTSLSSGTIAVDPASTSSDPEGTSSLPDRFCVSSKSATNEKRKKEVIQEIIDTEFSYVLSMSSMLHVYFHPLKEKGILSESRIEAIFANIQDILPINMELLELLNKYQKKDQSSQFKHISDIFNEFADRFKSYAVFCSNHAVSLNEKRLKAYQEENKKFRTFLQEAALNPECKSLGLPGFLIMPMQRLCRYPLLLGELKKCISIGDPELTNLDSTIEKIKEIVQLVNDQAQHATELSQLIEIEKMIEFPKESNFALTVNNRHLVHEGTFKIMKPNEKDGSYGFLFNDVLLLAKPKGPNMYVYRRVIDLKRTMVIRNDPNGTTLQVAEVEVKIVRVHFETREQRDLWAQHLSHLTSTANLRNSHLPPVTGASSSDPLQISSTPFLQKIVNNEKSKQSGGSGSGSGSGSGIVGSSSITTVYSNPLVKNELGSPRQAKSLTGSSSAISPRRKEMERLQNIIIQQQNVISALESRLLQYVSTEEVSELIRSSKSLVPPAPALSHSTSFTGVENSDSGSSSETRLPSPSHSVASSCRAVSPIAGAGEAVAPPQSAKSTPPFSPVVPAASNSTSNISRRTPRVNSVSKLNIIPLERSNSARSDIWIGHSSGALTSRETSSSLRNSFQDFQTLAPLTTSPGTSFQSSSGNPDSGSVSSSESSPLRRCRSLHPSVLSEMKTSLEALMKQQELGQSSPNSLNEKPLSPSVSLLESPQPSADESCVSLTSEDAKKKKANRNSKIFKLELTSSLSSLSVKKEKDKDKDKDKEKPKEKEKEKSLKKRGSLFSALPNMTKKE